MENSDTISVKQLDCDVLTLAYLERFLQVHGWPDRVIVHPADFVRLHFLASSSSLHGLPHASATAPLSLLGTEWVRGSGYSTELNWEAHELRDLER